MNDKMRTGIMKTALILFESGHTIKEIQKSLSKESFVFANAAIKMYVSFAQAVDDAGGTGWLMEELLKMTMMDLISKLSTNNVRFIFEKPFEKPKEKIKDG